MTKLEQLRAKQATNANAATPAIDLSALMNDFTKTAGSISIALVSSVGGIAPIFVGNVSLYREGHDYYKQSHSILLKLAEDIATNGNSFDLSNIKLPLKGGWASMFKKPDIIKNSSAFFNIKDMQDVLDSAEDDDDTDDTSIMDQLANLKDDEDSFLDDLEGYLNIYLTFRDVDYRLKDLPLLGKSLWEKAIISYLLYQSINNPDSNFSDYMDDFKFIITDLRLTEELDLTNVTSGF